MLGLKLNHVSKSGPWCPGHAWSQGILKELKWFVGVIMWGHQGGSFNDNQQDDISHCDCKLFKHYVLSHCSYALVWIGDNAVVSTFFCVFHDDVTHSLATLLWRRRLQILYHDCQKRWSLEYWDIMIIFLLGMFVLFRTMLQQCNSNDRMCKE